MGWEPRPQAAEGAGARVEPELRHPGASEHLRAAPRARGGSAGRPAGAGRGGGADRLRPAGLRATWAEALPLPGRQEAAGGERLFSCRAGSGQRGPQEAALEKKERKEVSRVQPCEGRRAEA